jgi:hypothetical protein
MIRARKASCWGVLGARAKRSSSACCSALKVMARVELSGIGVIRRVEACALLPPLATLDN